jgi:hypothetical protein
MIFSIKCPVQQRIEWAKKWIALPRISLV